MRQVTKNAIAAFFAGVEGCWGNTQVAVESHRTPDGIRSYWVMRLHFNPIARRPLAAPNEPVEITNAGWDTRTTRDRLYGICDHLEVDRQVVIDLPDNSWTPIARKGVTA